jgi:hypothetical protein
MGFVEIKSVDLVAKNPNIRPIPPLQSTKYTIWCIYCGPNIANGECEWQNLIMTQKQKSLFLLGKERSVSLMNYYVQRLWQDHKMQFSELYKSNFRDSVISNLYDSR